jgi:hypothetical protein
MYDPVAKADEAEQKPGASRLSSIENARIGSFDDGKPAAGPTPAVVGKRLQELSPSVSVQTDAVDALTTPRTDEASAGRAVAVQPSGGAR